MAKILIAGCGDIGYRAGLALHSHGHEVLGLKRQLPTLPSAFSIIAADITKPDSLIPLPLDFDAVLIIVAPDQRQANVYQNLFDNGTKNLLAHFASARKPGGARPVKCLMVSSSSVYGQNHGEWVDESSSTEPDNPYSPWLIATEQRLLADNLEHCIVRFSGIYGPGRDRLLRRAANAEPIQQYPPLYTNRIHRDDCVAILVFLLEKLLAGKLSHHCYLASDDAPVPAWDLMRWLAQSYGHPLPQPLILPDDAPQNKRCSNARLKALGYQFIYPSYQAGYTAISQTMIKN